MQQNSHAIHRKITLSTVLASNLNYSGLALKSAVYSLPLLHFPYMALSKTLNLFSLINLNNCIYLSLLVYLFHLRKFWGQQLFQSPWENVTTSSAGILSWNISYSSTAITTAITITTKNNNTLLIWSKKTKTKNRLGNFFFQNTIWGFETKHKNSVFLLHNDP